ncbi:protein Thp3p [Trichomonascus vanleenenianus]|uniref:Thp3p n=1 Tax=Trichomonascus vanleenenianus TaxID=2268995 RepID=UPI003EC986C7
MNQKTAYTSVPASTTLSGSSTLNKNSDESKSEETKPQWPESLKRFVERCIQECHEDDKITLQKELKAEITKAFETNTTWTTNWDVKTLPVLEARKPKEKKKEQTRKYFERNQLDESEERRLKRQKRFEADMAKKFSKHSLESSSTDGNNDRASEEEDLNQSIVGRSTQLEKRYLRLTSAPNPDNVRPLHILKQTLELLKKKWKQEQNYAYICDQFKSLRQDLTVQHIQNEFTVQVYEIHARIALERADLGEYNQCQSQLKLLYEKGIPGNDKEFLAYRILYLLHTQSHSDIGQQLVGMSDDVRRYPPVAHALKVSEAMACRNYHRLFKLYVRAPNMGGYVMDSFITRERLHALSVMCRAYRPELELSFLTKELGFQDEEDCAAFLGEYSVTLTDTKKLVTKDAFPKFELARQSAFKKVDIKGQI